MIIETTGKVISGNYFQKFWNEITNNVYGKMIRVKGIVHLEDGNIIYVDFIYGVQCIDFLDLDLPRYLHSEPKFFSGLEIVGFSLNELALRRIIENIYVTAYT